MKKFLLLLLIGFTQSAYAYLDPASGSALLYIAFSAIGGALYALKRFALMLYVRVKSFLSNEDSYKQVHDLVFYSEHKGYWPVFEPVITALLAQGQPCLYLCSDKQDGGLALKHELFSSRYIGGVNVAAIQLNHLEAKVLVMTTPQLEVHQFKRSKNVSHYSHLVHAPVDVHTYKKFAFDYFDSVLCSNTQQIKSIRCLEAKRSLPAKDLRCIGLTYYDAMLDELASLSAGKKELSEPCHVLVCPTWKPYSLINRYGTQCLKPLLDAGLTVTLRPHPQSFVSFPEVVAEIELELSEYRRFSIDRSASSVEAMIASDMMLADLSGVIWDYAVLHKKPVLLVSTPTDLDGFEATEVSH